MAIRTETIQISGIRCERCVMRLGKVLESVEGVESANANLVGICAVIEKTFEGGRERMEKYGVKVEALAQIVEMTDDGQIILA